LIHRPSLGAHLGIPGAHSGAAAKLTPVPPVLGGTGFPGKSLVGFFVGL